MLPGVLNSCVLLLGLGAAGGNDPGPEPIRVLHDGGVIGALGTFSGPGDEIGLSTIEPSGGAPEGEKVLQALCEIGPGGFAGLFLETGTMEGDEAVDATGFAQAGQVRFWIRSHENVQVGIRSRNIGPGTERSKLWLRKEGLARLDGRWEPVRIDLRRFQALEPRLQFGEMQVLLTVAVVGGAGGPDRGFFEIDDVAWFPSAEPPRRSRRSDPLPLLLDTPDFDAHDGIGRWCRLSNAAGTLGEGIRRPSSGHGRISFDLESGAIERVWSHPGIGHGYQTVLPFEDGRYPLCLESMAKKLRDWTGVTVKRYGPRPTEKPIAARTQVGLERVASRLLALRAEYPTVEHDPEQDVDRVSEGNDVALLIRARATRARRVEVLYRAVAGDGPADPPHSWAARERGRRPFAAFLPWPPSVYEERLGQAHRRRLSRARMVWGNRGFEARIPLPSAGAILHYVFLASDEKGRATVGLAARGSVFVSPR